MVQWRERRKFSSSLSRLDCVWPRKTTSGHRSSARKLALSSSLQTQKTFRYSKNSITYYAVICRIIPLYTCIHLQDLKLKYYKLMI